LDRRGGWFQNLFGFEESAALTSKCLKSNFIITNAADDAILLESKINSRKFNCGKFSTPSLRSIRSNIPKSGNFKSTVVDNFRYSHDVIGDALPMHSQYGGAVFQVASQFNCLEFTTFHQTPECGVDIYQYDHTQGPACAMACGAGTVFRNYFAPVFLPGQSSPLQYGQSIEHQINNLDQLELAVENHKHNYWYVQNGYTFSKDAEHLCAFNKMLSSKTQNEVLDLMGDIKVGLHEDVGVTFATRYVPLTETTSSEKMKDIRVTQVYSSALSCSYSGVNNEHWAPLAELVLNATYEATVLIALLHAYKCQQKKRQLQTDGSELPGCSPYSNDVFLTFIGGGVFGNEKHWIASAIGRALAVASQSLQLLQQPHDQDPLQLRVHVCHYRSIDVDMQCLVDKSYHENMANKIV